MRLFLSISTGTEWEAEGGVLTGHIKEDSRDIYIQKPVIYLPLVLGINGISSSVGIGRVLSCFNK